MRLLMGWVLLAACGDQTKIDDAYARGVKDGIAQERQRVAQTAKVNAQLAITREEIVKREVHAFAYDAYTRWSGEHLQEICPTQIEELLRYMNPGASQDLWGIAT